jgi:transcriptional regulator with XRE-family HTH domain
VARTASVSGEERMRKAKEIAGRLVQARNECGLVQEEAAVLIGVSARSISEWEKGNVIPDRFMQRIADAYGVQKSWLWHGDEALKAQRDAQLEELNEKLDLVILVAEQLQLELAEIKEILPGARGDGAEKASRSRSPRRAR